MGALVLFLISISYRLPLDATCIITGDCLANQCRAANVAQTRGVHAPG